MDELSDRDENNMRFFLTAPKHVLDAWWANATEADMQYAQALMEIARIRLIDIVVERHGTPDAERVLSGMFKKS